MNNHYRGEIGGVAVFNRDLTATELFRLHAAMLREGEPATVFAFNNSGGSATAAASVAWKAFRNAATDATSNTANGWTIANTPGSGGSGGFLTKTLTGESGIAWTKSVPAIPTTVIDRVEFTLNNSSSADTVHLAVKTGGQWHVTGETFAMTTNGNTASQWNLAQTKTFQWTRDAAAWRLLDFNENNTLQLNAAPPEKLPSGPLQAVGFYQPANTGTLRIDDLKIYVHPGDVADSHKTSWLWQAEHFDRAERQNAAVSGPDADPDRDGRVNLIERALGGDPRHPDASFHQPSCSLREGRLALTYHPADPSVSYTVEVTDNLQAWDHGIEHVELLTGPGPGEMTGVDKIASSPSGTRFIRLRITAPNH